MNEHVRDELELFALGALTGAERDRVAAHLATCAACREEASALGAVADALARTLPERDAPASLRARVLASARADLVDRRTPRTRALPRIAALGLVAAVIALAALNVQAYTEQRRLEAELERTEQIALRVGAGGRTWEMHGVDRWRGASAMLVAPKAAPAFVVFRDLPEADGDAVYTIWLVDENGRWVRGSTFDRAGRVQLVDVGVPVEGFEQCAVTLETRREGRRQGPVVMSSRIYQGSGGP